MAVTYNDVMVIEDATDTVDVSDRLFDQLVNAICALQVEICVIAAVLRVLVNAIEEAATVAS